MACEIPNPYTACEEYRGFVIATFNNFYRAFLNGKATQISGYSRQACRRKINFKLDQTI